MVKHRRRRATTRKSTRPSSVRKRFFLKVKHSDAEIAKVRGRHFEGPDHLYLIGLESKKIADPEYAILRCGHRDRADFREHQRAATECVFKNQSFGGIQQPDDLTKVATNPRRNQLSEEKQRYVAALLYKYGSDFDAMGCDRKLNVKQLTAAKLKKMTAKFISLDPKHRKIPMPGNAPRVLVP